MPRAGEFAVSAEQRKAAEAYLVAMAAEPILAKPCLEGRARWPWVVGAHGVVRAPWGSACAGRVVAEPLP